MATVDSMCWLNILYIEQCTKYIFYLYIVFFRSTSFQSDLMLSQKGPCLQWLEWEPMGADTVGKRCFLWTSCTSISFEVQELVFRRGGVSSGWNGSEWEPMGALRSGAGGASRRSCQWKTGAGLNIGSPGAFDKDQVPGIYTYSVANLVKKGSRRMPIEICPKIVSQGPISYQTQE